ncbi:MAG: PDZ domain-containing protein [Rhodocyclaceae bacterium]
MRHPWACIVPLCALSVSACSFLPASVSDSRPAAPAAVVRSASPTGTLTKAEECPTQANRQPHESPFVGIGAEDCCDARGIKGAYVVKLYEDSPAKNAKLRIADRIFQFGGCRIETVGQLANAIANATVRAGVIIHFARDVRADSVTVFTRSASPGSSHRGSAPRSVEEKERVCREAGLRLTCLSKGGN